MFIFIRSTLIPKDAVNVLGNILARIPVSKLDNPVGAIEYFTKEGTWLNNLDPRE